MYIHIIYTHTHIYVFLHILNIITHTWCTYIKIHCVFIWKTWYIMLDESSLPAPTDESSFIASCDKKYISTNMLAVLSPNAGRQTFLTVMGFGALLTSDS